MTRMTRWRWTVVLVLLLAEGQSAPAQGTQYIAMIPVFHDRQWRGGLEGPLHLHRQRFVMAVFRNAVAVYSEAEYVNNGTLPIEQELALPSTGHDENGDLPGGRISNGLLDVQMWIQDRRVEPQFVNDGIQDWVAIRARFEPGEERKVNALFWVQTSYANVDSIPGLDSVAIPDGDRGFLVDVWHAAPWNGSVGSLRADAILEDGLRDHDPSFRAEPDTYETQDSVLVWRFYDLEPSQGDNIEVKYSSVGRSEGSPNTMASLSAMMIETVYGTLREYLFEQSGE